jgi:SAM-dependent methyltransferase
LSLLKGTETVLIPRVIHQRSKKDGRADKTPSRKFEIVGQGEYPLQRKGPIMIATSAAARTADIDALEARLIAAWIDYVSRSVQPGVIDFLNRLSIDRETSLLDVTFGPGQLGLIAARRGARVTSVDIATNSILAESRHSVAEGPDARVARGDAAALAYANGTFDVVTSVYGAMFAPRRELMATELLRVCRSNGRIAMGNWTAEGFVGKMFKLIAHYFGPGMLAPLLWGNERVVRECFARGVSELRLTRVSCRFDYPFGPGQVVDFLRHNHEPTARAFATLGKVERETLRVELERLWASHNRSSERGRTIVDTEYLEVIAVRA